MEKFFIWTGYGIDKWVSVKNIVDNRVLSSAESKVILDNPVQSQMLPDKSDISCGQLILSIHILPVAQGS